MDFCPSACEDMTQNIAEVKAELRSQALERRDALPANDRRLWSEEMTAHMLKLPYFLDHPGPVAGFWPIRSEIDVRDILSAAEHAGKELALPAIVNDEIIFRSWRNGSPLSPRKFDLWVPPPQAAVVQPKLLIVPMAAFDLKGARIGYGKGYYDRAIARLKALHGTIRTIGVAFAAQEVETIPMESWDQRLDYVVTERGVAVSNPQG